MCWESGGHGGRGSDCGEGLEVEVMELMVVQRVLLEAEELIVAVVVAG